MYFVGLPEREKMAYATRVEALQRRFGQETDTSIALQELAGLRRGKNQSAKELADSARRLASRAYHSNDYASGTSRFPNGSRRGSTIEVRRAELSDLGDAGGNRRDPGTIHQDTPFRERMPDQRYGRTLGKRTVAAVAEESVMVGNGLYLPGRIEGNGVSFLVDTGSGVSILAARRKWGRAEDSLTRYWGRLCSVEGRALECLGKARLTVTLATRVIE